MAEVEKIDEYVDRQAVKSETGFLIEQLDAVLKKFDELNAKKVTLSGVSSMKDVAASVEAANKSIAELTAQNAKLQKSYDDLAKKLSSYKTVTNDNSDASNKFIQISGQIAVSNKQIGDSFANVGAKINAQLGGTVEDAVERLLELNDALKANKKAQQDLQDQKGTFSKMNQDIPEVVEGISQITQRQKELKQQEFELKGSISDTNKEIKQRLNLNLVTPGTRDEIKDTIKSLKVIRDAKIDINTEEGQAQVAELNEEIDRLGKILEQTTDKFEKRKINIGNYQGSAAIIVEALEKARQKFDDLSKAADTTPAALDDARRHFESLRGVVDDKQFVKYAAAAGDAQKEVKAFTRVLIDLETRGEGNSQVAIDLRKQLAELTDQIADTKDEIRALASDSRSFDLFAGSVNFAVDTIQTFVGAMSLSADSEEDVQEATKTLIALQTVSNGIKGIATELTTKGTAANKLYAFAQKQVAIAMDETAATGVRLRAVMATIGFGAVIIGIGLLIANFDKIKRAISGVSKEQEAYNEVMKEAGSEYAAAVKTVNQLKTNIDLAKEGFIQKEQVIKEYNDTLGKTTGQVKSLDEAEKAITANGEAYIQMALKKAVANIALEKAAQKAFEAEEISRKKQEEFARAIDQPNGRSVIATPGSGSFNAAEFDRQQKEQEKIAAQRKQAAIDAKNNEVKVYTDIADEASKAAAEIAKKFNLNFFGNNAQVQQTAQQKKFRDGVLKDDADMYKKLSENQDAYLTTRLSAREKSFELEKQILAGQKSTELENLAAELKIERDRESIREISKEELAQKEKEFANKRAEINKDYAEKQTLLESNLGRDIFAIRQSYIARQRELDQQYNEDFKKDQTDRLNVAVDAIQKEQLRRLTEDAAGQQKEIGALNAWYEKRVAATREGSKARNRVEDQYAQKRAEIEYQYAVAAVKNEIWAAEQILAIHKAAGIDVTEEEKKISELKTQLSDLETKHFIDNENKKTTAFQKRMQLVEEGLQKAQDIEGKVSDIIGGFISANVDRQKNAIQDQIDGIDKKKDADIAAVEASTLSTQEKADKEAEINAKAVAQKEALERRQRQLDLQRAQYEKAANITRIVVENALAVVHQLSSGDPFTAIPRAIAAGVLGAAQLAVAIAQPLPRFKSGRKGGPATFGVVGDGGVSEVVTSPDMSQAYITPATDTATFLPKNWNVFPSVKEFQETAISMLNKPLPALPIINNNNDGLIRAMAYEIGGLKRAILGKQETHFHWNNGELHKAIKNGNDWYRYVQNNI